MGENIGKNAKLYVGQAPKVIADGKTVTCVSFQTESGPDIWEGDDGFGGIVRDTKPFPMATQTQRAYSEATIRFIAQAPPKTISVEFQGKTYDRILKSGAEQRWVNQWECEAVLSVSA